jgi:hypothetical protein
MGLCLMFALTNDPSLCLNILLNMELQSGNKLACGLIDKCYNKWLKSSQINLIQWKKSPAQRYNLQEQPRNFNIKIIITLSVKYWFDHLRDTGYGKHKSGNSVDCHYLKNRVACVFGARRDQCWENALFKFSSNISSAFNASFCGGLN